VDICRVIIWTFIYGGFAAAGDGGQRRVSVKP